MRTQQMFLSIFSSISAPTPTNEAEHHTAQGATKIIDHNHPTYLHASDVGEISLVSLQLTVSMRIALLARNKLGFVNGT
ncbi:hypothetical protein KY285_021613 [Solanum tuberosum]|nr:hypothetical protein KY284_021684 [Solanum tuberosum]KAH0684946.1 hypothetical protein KY289_022698 [Solanum tuberosum]KAH0694516.1 hypothetical protein KY285_021613 [Solanum tuberosum]